MRRLIAIAGPMGGGKTTLAHAASAERDYVVGIGETLFENLDFSEDNYARFKANGGRACLVQIGNAIQAVEPTYMVRKALECEPAIIEGVGFMHEIEYIAAHVANPCFVWQDTYAKQLSLDIDNRILTRESYAWDFINPTPEELRAIWD